MNTYIVNIKNNYNQKYFVPIFALSEDDAFNIVIKLYNSNFMSVHHPPYSNFPGILPLEQKLYPFSEQNVIIKSALAKQKNTMEECTDMEIKELYNYMYLGDYNSQIQNLAEKALQENWNFTNKNDYSILKNYLNNTFKQLLHEDKVIETDSYCLFNTGLFTEHYIPIYAYGEINKNFTEDNEIQKWYLKGFKDEYELASLDVDVDFPERADYFKDTTLLVFDWHCKIHVNYDHILDDLNTYKRLPDCIKESDRPLDTLKGYIDTAIQRVTANYKLAVPHYYMGKIQLMIPLCFNKDNTPDVALVLEKRSGKHYQAKTCLTMEMAYMDARLIAKPESNWLMAENILETE
jgi:hypothetical protein